MNSSFIAELHRLVNEYRACINKAENIHAKFMGVPTKSLIREEIRTYKTAAELCGKIAGMYDYSEVQCGEWLEKQSSCERKLRELVYIHDNGLPASSPEDEQLPTRRPAAKGEKQSGQQAEKETAGKGGKRPGEGVPQEMVDSWHKPRPNVTFEKDVAGMEELIAKLRACVQDVASSSVNEYMGMERIHSFFLYGPPGGGKTHVTRAFIHELMGEDYTYLFLSGGDVHQSLVGMSEKVVERAFEEAKACSPCILFIDEIDSVCRNRNEPHLPAHATNTTTAFLNGYNSLSDAKNPVIFIGATNYPDKVDPAMLDRVELLKVPLPDMAVRTDAFKRAFEKILANEPGFSYEDMADETDNFSQRDVKRLVDMVKRAVKNDLKEIYGEDSEAMIKAMQDKEYLLKKEMFMSVRKEYQPSRKEEIMRNLDKWDAERSSSEEA